MSEKDKQKLREYEKTIVTQDNNFIKKFVFLLCMIYKMNREILIFHDIKIDIKTSQFQIPN